MSVFKAFLYGFYTLFLGLLLLINISMFVTMITGHNVFGIPYNNITWDFNNYYFGFTSITRFIDYFSNVLRLDELYSSMEQFFNACIFNALPPQPTDPDIVKALAFLINILLAPITIFLYGINLLGWTLFNLFAVLSAFFKLFGGDFNTPLPTYNNILAVLPYMVCF